MTVIYGSLIPNFDENGTWDGSLCVNKYPILTERDALLARGLDVDKIVVSLPKGCTLFGIPLETPPTPMDLALKEGTID